MLSLWCKGWLMTVKQNAVIDELERKVEQLIKLYIASQENERKLETELTLIREENERLKCGAQQLTEEINHLKVANAIAAGEGNSEAKMKISHIVREIDKCIALLNN